MGPKIEDPRVATEEWAAYLFWRSLLLGALASMVCLVVANSGSLVMRLSLGVMLWAAVACIITGVIWLEEA